MLEEVGIDTLEVFGESGTGKTSFCLEILKNHTGKAVYIDTERNLLKAPENCTYHYVPDFREVYKLISTLPDGYSLVILDSLGLPILGQFATMGVKERGDVLLQAQSVSYLLKKYSFKNKALVIVTNQPESEFNKEKGHILRPFGDKSIYFFKEVWKTEQTFSTPGKTVCTVNAFRSRSCGRGKPLYRLEFDNSGTKSVKIVEATNGDTTTGAIATQHISPV